jgi:hypothetical protein
MENVSGFGTVISLTASESYPVGFPITTFSNDIDAFDFPSIQVADFAMGLNGDGISYSKANPVKWSVSVIAGSLDDQNLSVLLNNNTPGKNKTNVQDIITVTIVYPDFTTTTLLNGVITDGSPGKSFGSDGRLKTRTYLFSFESVIGS